MIDVACGIILYDSKVLVAQRSEKMSLPLKWEFPGGKIEAGESARSCLCRELTEELNIEIEIIGELNASAFQYPTFSINLIPIVAIARSKHITLREHKTISWATLEELKRFDWADADLPVLEQFLISKYARRALRKPD